jgi:hypothetical protein
MEKSHRGQLPSAKFFMFLWMILAFAQSFPSRLQAEGAGCALILSPNNATKKMAPMTINTAMKTHSSTT